MAGIDPETSETRVQNATNWATLSSARRRRNFGIQRLVTLCAVERGEGRGFYFPNPQPLNNFLENGIIKFRGDKRWLNWIRDEDRGRNVSLLRFSFPWRWCANWGWSRHSLHKPRGWSCGCTASSTGRIWGFGLNWGVLWGLNFNVEFKLKRRRKNFISSKNVLIFLRKD